MKKGSNSTVLQKAFNSETAQLTAAKKNANKKAQQNCELLLKYHNTTRRCPQPSELDYLYVYIDVKYIYCIYVNMFVPRDFAKKNIIRMYVVCIYRCHKNTCHKALVQNFIAAHTLPTILNCYELLQFEMN